MSDAKPGIPKKPIIAAVKKFIGKCNPIEAPKILTKNKHKTPITSLTVPCISQRIGFNGAPTTNSNTINAMIPIITKDAFIFLPPLPRSPYKLMKRGRKLEQALTGANSTVSCFA